MRGSSRAVAGRANELEHSSRTVVHCTHANNHEPGTRAATLLGLLSFRFYNHNTILDAAIKLSEQYARVARPL